MSNAIRTVTKDLQETAGIISVMGGDALVGIARFLPKLLGQVLPVTKEVLCSPFTAGEEYLIEDGVSDEEAHQRAFALIEQGLSVNINKGARKVGSLLHASMEFVNED